QVAEYYPFGSSFVPTSPNNDNKYLYNGKEKQDDVLSGTNLDWYDYGARFYDPQIGRFFTQDRLAEKFAYMSPYQFCSNNSIWLKELDGLEGIKYTDADGVKTIEKNVVVLTEQHKDIPKNAKQKQIDRITKQNERIDARNTAKVADVQTRLNNTYNGADGKGTQNSAGETVKFKFNVTGSPTNNTEGGTTRQVIQFGIANGIVSSESDVVGNCKVAPAAIVTTRSANGSQGLSNGVFVTESPGAPAETLPHEIGHTFLLPDNYPSTNGSLMDYPPSGLSSSDVDQIWDKSYAK
ncbi:MAG: RHS repeat-associated core domain-containing protein, partial [Bacteroidota bacterium]|nr:RHS repeat-associated core domain-containing protein [Bacteroidota bacterium]